MATKSIRKNESPRRPMPATAPPDQAQRDRIERELHRCLLVEAGAGAGKTERLVARMIALLGAGECTIATLAAITFTRKAAAELRARFQVALERSAREAEETRRKLLMGALAHVEQAFIGTIHSFCARLLRERPVEAGTGVNFTEVDQSADDRLRREAWGAYVADLHQRGDPLLGELERLGLEVGLLSEAFIRFAGYPDVQEWPVPDVELPDLASVVVALRAYAQHMQALLPNFPAETGTDALIPRYRLVPRLVRQADLTQPAAVLEVLERFAEQDKIVNRSWPGGAAQARAELQRWNQFVAEHAAPRLEAWRALRYRVVLRVLHEARAVYDRLRRDRECLNFADLLLCAAALLREHPAVRRYFRARFTHVLVDEFQDTDPIQAEVMFLLTADDPEQADWRQCRPVPGALCIVADPKQSIYRFRRADVTTYNQVKEALVAGGGAVAELWANFRSQGPLLEWINETFTAVFPTTATPQMPAGRPMAASRTDLVGDLQGVYLLRSPAHLGEKGSIAAHEADLIARTIRRALDEGLTVPRTTRELQRGVPAQAQPGDFLIVTRTTKQLARFARVFQEYRIPCQVTGGSAWDEVPELGLLALMLNAVTRPEDPIALVSVLRSELFGISDAQLYAFAQAGGRFDYRAPLPTDLEPATASVFTDVVERLRQYADWLAHLPSVSATERIVADLGLMARAAASAGGNGQAGTLAKALELLRAAQAELPSVTAMAAFFDGLVKGRDKFNGLPARPHDGSVVRVMNLHQVKGLEAPVVFLADPSGAWEPSVALHVDRSGPAIRGYMAVFEPDAGFHPPLLACPPGWDSLADGERQFAHAEEHRLRYVAATRGGSQVVISQRSRLPQHNPWRFFDPHLAGRPSLPDPGPVAVPAGPSVALTTDNVAAAQVAVATRWESVAQASYARVAVKEQALTGAVPPGFGAGQGPEWGTALHRLLQMGLTDPHANLSQFAPSVLQAQGLDPALADDAVRSVQSALASDLGRRALRSVERLMEVPFQVQRAGALPTLWTGVIDLVFREGDGWVLVDWKTDVVPAARLAEWVAYYRPQVLAYAAAWQELTGQPVCEVVLYFTHIDRSVTSNFRRATSGEEFVPTA
ncbi:MAG: UvrD-helicase domain-containing protein [Gemmataceae bacterium]|nr:UvrD-helicase domain-containing protein [Gemmataceae bacterium]